MLEIIYNKWFIGIISSILLTIIIYNISDCKKYKNKKEKNKYFIKILLILFLIIMIILHAYEYYINNYKDEFKDVFKDVFKGGLNEDIKIIDTDIETDIGEWNNT